MDEIKVTPASGEDWHAFIARAGQPDGATERVVLEVHQRLLAVEERLPRVDPAATTAPLPSMDRDAVAAGWRKIREEREATTADGLSPVEAAPQAQQGVPSAPELWELARVAKEQDRTGTGGPEWDDSHHIHQRDHIVAHRALFAHGFQRGLEAGRAPQGVTVEELACLLSEAPIGDLGAAYWLRKHPRIGPLLRGEGAPAPKRVLLPEEPNNGPALYELNRTRDRGCFLAGWKAARAEVERQQQGGQADG